MDFWHLLLRSHCYKWTDTQDDRMAGKLLYFSINNLNICALLSLAVFFRNYEILYQVIYINDFDPLQILTAEPFNTCWWSKSDMMQSRIRKLWFIVTWYAQEILGNPFKVHCSSQCWYVISNSLVIHPLIFSLHPKRLIFSKERKKFTY